jgi:hypothetical protein
MGIPESTPPRVDFKEYLKAGELIPERDWKNCIRRHQYQENKHRHRVMTSSGGKYWVDERTSVSHIRRMVPNFFKTPHGKRETYRVYRGFLIVSLTRGVREHIVYLYTGDKSRDTLCMSAGNTLLSMRRAERLVDTIISTGKYEYGMSF